MPKKNKGLTSKEAKDKLAKYGTNMLPEKSPPSSFSILISQLKSPLVYILFFAGLVTFFLREYSDTVIIFVAVFINSVLGFFQETKANNALVALKKMVHLHATVVRDGEQKTIPSENIVPGDVCVINSGDKIPADGVTLEANRLFVDEALLTGESLPVKKRNKSKVFMGTIVSGGRGVFKVLRTGAKTNMGKIALSVQEVFDDTPLKRQLSKFSRQLSYLVVFLVSFVFVVGLISGKGIVEIFATSVALAVSSIPEGLLVGLTVVLAIGMQKILKRKGLVRNLVSAETLGGVTVICSDKTGTLTKGQMSVSNFFGNEDRISEQVVLANDLDDPIVVAAYEWGKKKTSEMIIKKAGRIDSIPFSAKNRLFISLNKWNKSKNIIFVNGAPDYLIDMSTLTMKEKEKIIKQINELTRNGKRLMGLARKKVSSETKKILDKDLKGGFEWVGMISFSDQVRPGVRDALEKTKRAGIDLIVITGDYSKTAVSVLNQLGIDISESEIVTGSQLSDMSDNILLSRLKRKEVKLFARTIPEQKLRIVEALKKADEVVAMTGDGVNDAPALNRADIGIVVGEATEVAKESADLVLLDSSFDTIVAAVEEGRGLYDNLRKIILYLMSDAFEGILTVTGALVISIFTPIPLPVSAVQILWINLVSDGFPHLALTVDPKAKDIMKKFPRSSQEPLVNDWMKRLIIIVSGIGGVMALSMFLYVLFSTNDEILARSATFATLGVNSLVYVFSVRTLIHPFWDENLFGNKWLNFAVLGGFVFQIVPFLIPQMRRFLEIEQLPLSLWVLVFGASLVMFFSIEMSKYIFRHKSIQHSYDV